jgi:hypothetical protein
MVGFISAIFIIENDQTEVNQDVKKENKEISLSLSAN